MASRTKPGIPDTFTFDVEPVGDLGDYLDESRPRPALPRPGRESPPAGEPPVRADAPPRQAVPPRAANADVRPPAPPAATQPQHEPAKHGSRDNRPRHQGPRREIAMTPESHRMSDELLELVRSGSGQRDTTASELFHALVLLVYEAKDALDLHVIPKRGRWGSPTARAYPLELKRAFLRAVQERSARGEG